MNLRSVATSWSPQLNVAKKKVQLCDQIDVSRDVEKWHEILQLYVAPEGVESVDWKKVGVLLCNCKGKNNYAWKKIN